ncbi:hypothetical protein KCP75_18805 [Salmonella enterica subsp. enterica]|nr:hypothetical protein KCP75_18805 [Salmonella enterica subsp. enterica]
MRRHSSDHAQPGVPQHATGSSSFHGDVANATRRSAEGSNSCWPASMISSWGIFALLLPSATCRSHVISVFALTLVWRKPRKIASALIRDDRHVEATGCASSVLS